MKRLVFLDCTTPKPYDLNTLKNEPLGGSEATAVRIAERLADDYEVIVAQHNRKETGQGKAAYVSFEALDQIHKDPHAVICMRTPSLVTLARECWSDSKLFLHLQDFSQQQVVQQFRDIKDTGVKIVCVSKMHQTVTSDAILTQVRDIGTISITHVYNPVDDDLLPDSTPVNPLKLVFMSSPHKGLDLTLKMYAKLREFKPFELYVANPGYMPDAELPAGVINIGQVPHATLMQHVREALCSFHCNPNFQETFGIVSAEANAVGTPVLTASHGANPEVLNPAYLQMVDVRSERAVVNRVLKWFEQRPAVSCKPEFRLANVVSRWRDLIQ